MKTCNRIVFVSFILLLFVILYAQENEGKIAFYSERDGYAEIYVINADGSDLQRLTNNNANDRCPSWSSDGTKIAFSSDRTGNSDIYIMDSDGSNQTRLTFTPEKESQPEWSPDDSLIAFTRWSANSWIDGDIYVMDPNGNNEQQLTFDPYNDARANWYPDGSKLMFNSTRDGNYEVYTMDADGNNQQRITNTATDELFPMISPDTLIIAYTLLDFATFTGEIYTMNTNGTNNTILTNSGDVSEDQCWTDDGSQIVFQTNRTGNFEIFMMNSDGSEEVNITNDPGNDFWPSWTPDTPIGIIDNECTIQSELKQNFPNPFNPATTISFSLTTEITEDTELLIYNLKGQKVRKYAVLKNQSSIIWDGTDQSNNPVSSGIYYYRLNMPDSPVKKMMLIK